mmetsp:Transcript_18784/g.58440  ORF Transcript_18784/g.58440 Transcript_18784/m.58440 type:complete len:265 (+) Transcript_18784:1866-2660(+)
MRLSDGKAWGIIDTSPSTGASSVVGSSKDGGSASAKQPLPASPSPPLPSASRGASPSPPLPSPSRTLSSRRLSCTLSLLPCRSRASCCDHQTSPALLTRKPPAEARAMTRRRMAASMSSRAIWRDCSGSRQPPPIILSVCSSRVSRRLRMASYSTCGTYAYLVATTRLRSSHSTLVMHTSSVIGRTPLPNAVSLTAVYARMSMIHDVHMPRQHTSCSVQNMTAVGPPPREARSGTTKSRFETASHGRPPSSHAIRSHDTGKHWW